MRAAALAPLLLCAPLCRAVLPVFGGVATRRVDAGGGLPWVYEADYEATQKLTEQQQQQQAEESYVQQQQQLVQPHDPLASSYWPAARPLAALIAESGWAKGQRVLELGAGTGLCSLTAASSGAASVLATDVSELALQLLSSAAAEQGLAVRTARLDALDASSQPLPPADLLVLSDLFVTEELARGHARRCAEALASGYSRVLVVDPGRSTREGFLRELEALGLAHEHEGFAALDACLEAGAGAAAGSAAAARRLLLLDTAEGQPVDYAI